MSEKTAALALEEQITAMDSGAPGRVNANRGGLQDLVEVAQQLRTLGTEWGRLPPPALQEQVTFIAEQAATGLGRRSPSIRPGQRRVLPIGFAVTAAATLLIAVVPAARDGVARQLYRVLDVVRIGVDTEVVRPDVPAAGEVAATLQRHERDLASGRRWFIHTPYGGFGGGVPTGASPALQRVDRLDLLRSLTSMTIQLPTVLHRGTPLTFNHALVAPDSFLLMFFGSGDNEILLVQAQVGGGRGMQYSRVVGGTDKQGRSVQYSPELMTEELVLEGQTVVWDPDTTGLIPNSSALRWEREGVSYSLMGRALTRNQAVELFLGLRSADSRHAQ